MLRSWPQHNLIPRYVPANPEMATVSPEMPDLQRITYLPDKYDQEFHSSMLTTIFNRDEVRLSAFCDQLSEREASAGSSCSTAENWASGTAAH